MNNLCYYLNNYWNNYQNNYQNNYLDNNLYILQNKCQNRN